MGLTVSKCPDMATRQSVEASDDHFRAKCSRTEFCAAKNLLKAYDAVWSGAQASSSAPLDSSPPATPPRQQPRKALHCSTPNTPIYDTPPPNRHNHSTGPRYSPPTQIFDEMDDLTEFGRVLYCTANWLPETSAKPIGVLNALAVNSTPPSQNYRETSSWTHIPGFPLPILRSLSVPPALSTKPTSDADHSSLQFYLAAAQQYLPNTSNRHRGTYTSSTQYTHAAVQKMHSTANVVTSRIKKWWSNSAANKPITTSHHPF